MKLLMVGPILCLVFVGDGVVEEPNTSYATPTIESPAGVAEKPSTSYVAPTTESPAGLTEKINTRYMTPTSVSHGMTATRNTSYVTPTSDSHAVNPSTCNWCLGLGNIQECEVLNLQTQKPCSLDQFPNIGTTHCYTAAGTFMSSYAPEIVYTGFARGCINCTDKAAACAAFVAGFIAQPQNWTSLNCTIECCTGDNCNNQFVTAVPPTMVYTTTPNPVAPTSESHDKEASCAEFNTTLPFQNMTLLDCNIKCCSWDNCNIHDLTVNPTKATATPGLFPTTTVNQTQCISCTEFGPFNISCSTFSLVPCPFHCYSFMGILEYYSVDQVKTAPLEIRGCTNCPDKGAACLALNETFASSNNTLLACNVDGCHGSLCNNQNLTGLDRNETAPTPTVPRPRVPSREEEKEAVKVSIPLITDQYKWDFQTDKSFKEKIASVTTSFCTRNRGKCALKEAKRKRRALSFDLYTADQVNLLPDYPSNASGSLQVAFYVLQPLGLFIGNTFVLPRDTLVDIVTTHESEIEATIGANISRVETLFQPPSTPTTKQTTTMIPTVVKESDEAGKWIAIGVGVGVFVTFLILLVVLWLRKSTTKKKVTSSNEDLSMETFPRNGDMAMASENGVCITPHRKPDLPPSQV